MVLVVILEPVEQLLQDHQAIGTGMKRHIITFEGFHKRFRHAITLRALDGRSAHAEPQVLGKTSGFMRGITRPIIGQPFDRMGKPIPGTKAELHALEHQVPDAVPSDSSRGGPITQNLPIASIQAKSDPNPLARVTGDFKDIGAPATIGRKSDHSSFVGSFRTGPSPGQQKGVLLQDPIDPLVIDGTRSFGLSCSVQEGRVRRYP